MDTIIACMERDLKTGRKHERLFEFEAGVRP